MNTAWPVSLGGTGGTSKQAAIDNLLDGTTEVTDENLRIVDPADDTKILVFDVNGITTATTRTLTAPDASGTIPLLEAAQTWTATQTFKGTNATYVRIGSSGANTLDRGISMLNASDAIAGLITTVPNTVGTDAVMNFYVGGAGGTDLKLSLKDDGEAEFKGSVSITGASGNYLNLASTAPNTTGRGILMKNGSGNNAGAIELVPNTIGTNAVLDFYVGGVSGGDLWMRLFDNGDFQVPGVYIRTSASAANVFVDSAGTLARSTSSERYKKNIEAFEIDIESLAKLDPKTYQSKSDPDGDRRFGGLVSEELNAAGFGLFVEFNEDGQEEGIMYAPFAAVAVVSLAKRVKELEQRIAAIEAAIK